MSSFNLWSRCPMALFQPRHHSDSCYTGPYSYQLRLVSSILAGFIGTIHNYFSPFCCKVGWLLDCGSNSNDAVDFLRQNNIKSIIIDHHEINKPYPKANVIINPKKNNGYIEYDYLCATTLSYFFLEMFIKKNRYKVDLKKYLIYVLLATVADVMPLRKFNRLIAIKALQEFKIKNDPSTTPTRIFGSFFDFYASFLGQEGFENDCEP